MINKLYISTFNHKWDGAESILIDQYNLHKIIANKNNIDCHTSVEDISCDNISTVFHHATEIVLVNIDENISITNNNSFSYGRLFNELERHSCKVKNYAWNRDFNYLKNIRSSEEPVLWTVGCSVTEGIGVNPDDRWGTLLAEYLNLPEVTLSQRGTSIFWSADQLLRSDVREGDTVVWGITNVPRVEISNNWMLDPILIRSYSLLAKDKQYWTIDYFESETQVLTTLRNILQVVNFCNKIKANLYLANILDVAWVRVALKDFKNFIDLTDGLEVSGTVIKFIDLGTDKAHPGPEQHRQYATKLFNLIKENYHG